jgi:hypothetical protein
MYKALIQLDIPVGNNKKMEDEDSVENPKNIVVFSSRCNPH